MDREIERPILVEVARVLREESPVYLTLDQIEVLSDLITTAISKRAMNIARDEAAIAEERIEKICRELGIPKYRWPKVKVMPASAS